MRFAGMGQFDPPVDEAIAFDMIADNGQNRFETNVGDLADRMEKNDSSVGRQIDKLETAGLVYTYPSSSDSRIRVSELTTYGGRM